MKHQGRRVVRLADTTDHGGKVTKASSGTIVMGVPAALENDTVQCPKCKGNFLIKPGVGGPRHEGKLYAFEGDKTECGATLIASL